MMKHKLPCEIVQDLLPSYLEYLTSDVTNNAIHEHMETCNSCKTILQRMQVPESNMKEESDNNEQKEIDFLEKTRKKNLRSIWLTATSVLGIVIFGLFFMFYIYGSPIHADRLACDVSVIENQLVISGTSFESGVGISNIQFTETEEGVIEITFRSVIASPIHSGDFEEFYTASVPITQVRLENRILWDLGVTISPITSAVYLAKHDYIGEMPANSRTWQALDMANHIGGALNSLQTTEEPYGWTLELQEEILPANQANSEEYMRSAAYAILATIGNLGYVTYEYTVGNVEMSLTVTCEDATEFAGIDIKAFSESPAILQQLMELTDLA